MTSSPGGFQAEFVVPEGFCLLTENLELVPAGPRFSDIEWRDSVTLSAALGTSIPERWPPDVVVDQRSPSGQGWWDWYVVKKEDGNAILIGIAGLNGWSGENRRIKVGCSLLPAFQRQGYRTAAVKRLVEWVVTQPNVDCVTADTPLGCHAAAAILQRLGFAEVESGTPQLQRFERRTPGH